MKQSRERLISSWFQTIQSTVVRRKVERNSHIMSQEAEIDKLSPLRFCSIPTASPWVSVPHSRVVLLPLVDRLWKHSQTYLETLYLILNLVKLSIKIRHHKYQKEIT